MNMIKRILDAVNEGVLVAGPHKRTEGQVLVEQIQKSFRRDPWKVAANIERLRTDWDRQDSELSSALSTLPDCERCSATERKTMEEINSKRTALLMEAIYGSTEDK